VAITGRSRAAPKIGALKLLTTDFTPPPSEVQAAEGRCSDTRQKPLGRLRGQV
jgi:hypothetical protein